MSGSNHLQPPYDVGIIEDVPGERYYAIGAEYLIFARIPADLPRMEDTAHFLVRAANAYDELLAVLEESVGFLDRYARECRNITAAELHERAIEVIARAKGTA